MIYITFFGDFSLTEDTVTLSARASHAERLFRALAYLVKNRSRAVDTAEFSRFLHNDKDFSRYKGDSLVKTTLHRLRELLSVFGKEETIILKNGLITFSDTLTFSSDTERFEEIVKAYPSADDEEKLALFEEIITLYPARYLATFTGDSITMPESERYHRAFVSLCGDALERLIDRGDCQKAHQRAQRLIPIDPFCESFHYYRIYALFLSGDLALAQTLYQNVSLRYRREFHITPSARFHALKGLLQPKSHFDADSLNDALALITEVQKSEKGHAYLADPVDLLRAASLLNEGYFVFLKGDVDKILPDLTYIFNESTLMSRLCETALLLVTSLQDETFFKKYQTFEATVNQSHLCLKAEYRKIDRSSAL